MTDLAATAVATRSLLHVGCGPASPGKLPAQFFTPGEWREIRLDIDPSVAPDIIASITEMGIVPTASMDALFSSHNLEHLFAHEVPLALAEFRRVLRPGGFALVAVPDLQAVAALVAEGRLTDTAYESPAGAIAPLDMIYGLGSAIADGNTFMAHRTGFTASTLEAAMLTAGFAAAPVVHVQPFALWAMGYATAG